MFRRLPTVNTTVDRVVSSLRAGGVHVQLQRFELPVPTAAAAAAALGCDRGAIVNSLVFEASGEPVLVLASGAHRVDSLRLGERLKCEIRKASPSFVFERTGQTVGGVSPIGHHQRLFTVVDVALSAFSVLWAGAGDDRTMFSTTFAELLRVTQGRPLDVE